jgi:hypothetical protein
LLAVATPAEDATYIWDYWASAFSGPTDPPLPISFNQSAINPLQSPFADPEVLRAQLSDLATWARNSIRNRVFIDATEALDLTDISNWCAYTRAPPLTTSTYHTILPDSLFILSIHTLLLSYALFQHLLFFSSTHKPSTTLRPTPFSYHRASHHARPARHVDTKRFKRKQARNIYSTTTSNKAISPTTICTNNEVTSENLPRGQIKHRSKRKRASTRLLQCLLKHIRSDNTSFDNTRHNEGSLNTPNMQCNRYPTQKTLLSLNTHFHNNKHTSSPTHRAKPPFQRVTQKRPTHPLKKCNEKPSQTIQQIYHIFPPTRHTTEHNPYPPHHGQITRHRHYKH